MIDYDNKNWLALLVTLQGSVARSIAPRIAAFTVLNAFVVGLHQTGLIHLKDIPSTPWAVVGVALGLLLVFRTNTAYDRFWEGRKLWGEITNQSRYLGMGILAYLARHPDSAVVQQRLINLLTAFPVLTKHRLRQTQGWEEVKRLLSPQDQESIANAQHPPLATLSRITAILGQSAAQGLLTEQRLIMLNAGLVELTRCLGGCERIRNTPLPIAYVLHLKRFLSLFCLTISLPFVAVMGWWSVLATALVSYGFIGIEEIGVEIEDPFGDDPNDLPLDKICTTIEQNLTELNRLAEVTGSSSER
jgi:putative membrane protein